MERNPIFLKNGTNRYGAAFQYSCFEKSYNFISILPTSLLVILENYYFIYITHFQNFQVNTEIIQLSFYRIHFKEFRDEFTSSLKLANNWLQLYIVTINWIYLVTKLLNITSAKWYKNKMATVVWHTFAYRIIILATDVKRQQLCLETNWHTSCI